LATLDEALRVQVLVEAMLAVHRTKSDATTA